ncbi:hypothetical protein BC940DRAFT_294757 [Gongronella butleri]|nr:hypothetical protein BC940DRAFT_294757 [Gongronella butleri]
MSSSIPSSSTDKTRLPKHVKPRAYEENELVAEHLGSLPINFLDDFYNVSNLAMYKSLESLRKFFHDELASKPKQLAAVDKAFPAFEKYMEEKVDENFNLYSQYFYDNIIHLPADREFIPEHYKGLDLNGSEQDLEQLDKELDEARQQVIAEKAFQHKLLAEKKRLDNELEYLRQHNDALNLSQLEQKHGIQLNQDTLAAALAAADQAEADLKSLEQEIAEQQQRDIQRQDRRAYLSKILDRQIAQAKK